MRGLYRILLARDTRKEPLCKRLTPARWLHRLQHAAKDAAGVGSAQLKYIVPLAVAELNRIELVRLPTSRVWCPGRERWRRRTLQLFHPDLDGDVPALSDRALVLCRAAWLGLDGVKRLHQQLPELLSTSWVHPDMALAPCALARRPEDLDRGQGREEQGAGRVRSLAARAL